MGFDIEFKKRLFDTTAKNFEEKALLLFKYQIKNCAVYSEYVKHLKIDSEEIKSILDIPFLPIQFFKHHDIICNDNDKEYVFESSGTTGSSTSKHWVTDLEFYKKNTVKIFESFYGSLSQYTVLGLLPSYLERSNSSLVIMADLFINKSFSLDSGYYLYNHDELFDKLTKLKASKTPTLLLGVTFALLDFIERYSLDFPELIIMETGGMKGRKKEITRSEVHQQIADSFPSSSIHSEYGMTELFSQFYSLADEKFDTPPWVKAITREISDPFQLSLNHKQGGLNIIDLANVDSCAFIETEDLAQITTDGKVKILGRMDNSLQRGCNLLVS